jgi:hypothetical protein
MFELISDLSSVVLSIQISTCFVNVYFEPYNFADVILLLYSTTLKTNVKQVYLYNNMFPRQWLLIICDYLAFSFPSIT